jgi:hypothetical protein
VNDNSTTMIIDDPEAPERTPVEPAVEPAGTPFGMVALDVAWPTDDRGKRFSTVLPQPAIFQRAYRVQVHDKKRNKHVPHIRLVWLAGGTGISMREHFLLQTGSDSIELFDDLRDPVRLDLVIGSSGEPVMVWQLARRASAAVPEPGNEMPTRE